MLLNTGGTLLTLAAMSAAEHADNMPASTPPASKAAALGAAASQCVLDHCLFLLGNGDDSMVDCAKTVNQMLATCTALQSLAAQDSALLPAMAKVALEACTACIKQCRAFAA